MAGVDAAAALDDGPGAAFDAGPPEPCRDRLRREEAPVGGEVARGRQVDGRRDVPGDRVDGLDLAPVPLRGANVEEPDGPEQAGEGFAIDRVRPPRSGRRERRRRRLGDGGLERTADRRPRPEAAVEERDARVADRVEHPPQSRRDRAPALVVHHHLVLEPDAELTHPACEGCGGGQRMAARTRRCDKVGVDVHEDRARDVGLPVVAAAAARLGEVPADVADPEPRIVDAVEESLRRDEHGRRVAAAGRAASPGCCVGNCGRLWKGLHPGSQSPTDEFGHVPTQGGPARRRRTRTTMRVCGTAGA